MGFKIYFIRHGLPSNPNKIFYGRLKNFFLSETGIIEAQQAFKYINSKCKNIIKVFSSPMERALETAKPCEYFDKGIEINQDLNEINAPFWEGKKQEYIAEKYNWDVNKIPKEEGNENSDDVKERTLKFIKEMVNKYYNENEFNEIIVVTHQAVIEEAVLYALSLSHEERNKVPFLIHTGSVTEITFEKNEGIIKPVKIGYNYNYENDIKNLIN
jgi:broad specificity phosphatase PhoE